MNPEPQFVGRVGEVEEVGPPVDGEYWYRVRFGDSFAGVDYIDHCNLEVV